MLVSVFIKRSLVFIHRWLGIALCVVFLLWFPSGIGMMYWSYPDISRDDRLERSPALDSSTIALSPADALKTLGLDDAGGVRLDTFDGRPVYRIGGFGGQSIVYADTGEEQLAVPMEMVHRAAAAWTGQRVETATIEEMTDVDQWTVQTRLRDLQPLYKFSFPDGQQVYISANTGEVEQYTTTASRWGAYVGAIPHWLYFTPLRRHGAEWSKVVIWSSGIGTGAAILGLIVGVWMYSPSKKYRNAGAPTSIPYRGQKRWHTIFGLIFGVATATWAFSGMLSMDPFPQRTNRASGGGEQVVSGVTADPESIREALRGDAALAAFERKHPKEALTQLAGLRVTELQLASFMGAPGYLATLADGTTRIVPIDGEPITGFTPERISDVVKKAAGENGLAEIKTITQYDMYYLDRRRERPLPVVVARLNDAENTRLYIDPKTARVVSTYGSSSWMTRWLYHGLHSLDFPWLYNYRPLWDIVVITFMVGGTALCVTSLVLAWRVLGRKVRAIVPASRVRSELSEDLA
jgi:hypothetical protein